jgi:hypothetical protein
MHSRNNRDCTRSAHEITEVFVYADFIVQSIMGAMEKRRSSCFILIGAASGSGALGSSHDAS